jgi:glycine betaine transporter
LVYYISIIVIALFVMWGIFFPTNLSATAENLLNITVEKFGWFYLLTAFSILIFSLYLTFSKYGNIRLGSDEDRPEYSNISWFAMLFSAGMGIGLVFWGVAEPIQHYIRPPMGVQRETAEAALIAMRYSFFHWGLHPWAIYTLIGLCLAYFNFRKKSNSLISSTFFPLLKDKTEGLIGNFIDILSIIATSFGVATSLGLGALQINGGLHEVFGIPNNVTVQVTIIFIVTILYMTSAMTGLNKGIKILSNLNIVIAVGLLLFVMFLGPTSFIFDTLTTTIGSYVQNLIQMSLRLTPFTQGTWIGDWTLFYWAWWISWAPFVGTFIARVSKGRTIKEFVLGVLLVPSLFCFVWFAAFGGTALNFEMFKNLGIAQAVEQDVTSALFITLRHLPLGKIVSLLATTLIVTFFITSADSATFVLGMFSSKGDLNPKIKVKLVWGILQSSVAIILLISGGLDGLQTMAILAALPFAVILLIMCFSFYKAIKDELTN